MACGTQSTEPLEQAFSSFQQQRQDTALDQMIQPLLNQYFTVMAHLSEQDTTNLKVYGNSFVQMADSLTKQTLSKDTATQSNALQGVMNVQSEMEAILMESNTNERIFGAAMLSLHWIELLSSIGYQKQTIYLFIDQVGNQWMSLNKQSLNPYKPDDKAMYQASQVLQELQ